MIADRIGVRKGCEDQYELMRDYIDLAAELAKLREDYRLLREQFEYFVAAKRFDRKEFDDDTAMLDWMLSRSRHMLETTAKGRPG